MALRKKVKIETGQNNTEKKAGPVSLVILFAMMLTVFLVGAGMMFGYFKLLDPTGRESKAEQKEKEVTMHTMELGDMVVNLADTGSNHFLKLTITLEYPADKKTEEMLNEKKHLITETILLTLRNKTIGQVRPPDAVDRLKNELVAAVNNSLGDKVINRIYFTEYIVQ